MPPFLRRRAAFFIFVASLLIFSQAAFADPSRQTEVGSEEERLRRPKTTEVPERAIIPIEIPPEGELPAEAGKAVPIQVVSVAVEGATLLPDADVKSLTDPIINKTVTLYDLRKVALAITRWYRGKGYVTSRAFIPAQAVEKGLVRIRIVEGKVGQIKIEGNRWFSAELLRSYVRILPGDILWMPKLEESLVQLNAHPDRKVKLVLAPAAEPETTDIVLQVSDNKPFHASYGVDTLGTKETGLIRQSIDVSHGNLTGKDDQILVRGILSEFGGIKGGALSYLRPINSSGVLATFDVSGVTSSVGGDLKGLLARGDAVTISPGLVIPLVRRTYWELELVPGFDFKRIRTYLDDRTSSKDDLRVFRLGTNLLQQDTKGSGRGLFTQELRVGIADFLGGSHPEDVAASRAQAGGSFVRWLVNLARVQQGPYGTSLVLRGSSQVASHRLVPAEQMRLGGFDSVRGYPEGEFLADYGYQTTVEVRAPLERLIPGPSSDKLLAGRLRRSLQLVGFWDFAEGFLKGAQLGEDKDMRLSGVGCGFRLRPTAESVIQTDFGWAVGDRDSEKDRPRIHLICRIGF